MISAGMGRNRKRNGRVKKIRGKKENYAPPVVPAPPDTVFIKSPLCMAAFSLLEKLYNVPFGDVAGDGGMVYHGARAI